MEEAGPPVRIEPVGRRWVAEATAVLAAGLADLPGPSQHLPAPARRRLLQATIRPAVREFAVHGAAFVVVDDAEPAPGPGPGTSPDRATVHGALLAVPPGRRSLPRRVRSAVSLLPAVIRAPRVVLASVRSGMAIRRALPAGPGWYIHTVGVHPGAQGRGVGARLLRHALDLIDQTGQPCYLHTPSEAAAQLYRRFGFGAAQPAIVIDPRDPPFLLMVRPGVREAA